MSAPLTATDADYADVVATGKPTLVDFWAEWCGPCQKLSPVLDALAAERPDFAIVKVDIEQAPNTAQMMGVRGVPALFVLDADGTLVETFSAPKPKAVLADALRRAAIR